MPDPGDTRGANVGGLEKARPSNGILLLTELFPPAIGGSPVLFDNVYRRVRDFPVSILTGTAGRHETGGGEFEALCHLRLNGRLRGLVSLPALAQQLRIARFLRGRLVPQHGAVHCGRGLPEGAAAWLASLVPGAKPYLCWVHGEEVASALTSREYTWLMRRVYVGAFALLANSHHTRNYLTTNGLRAQRIEVVHPGVDADRFSCACDVTEWRARVGAGETDFLLLSVGRLQLRKGHDLVIKALPALEHVNIRYVVVGDGEERARLESLARSLGVRDRVHFCGAVPDSELAFHYAACDVFVMPNRVAGTDFEGFGIVFLEAAAAGKPVIAGCTGGAAEAVDDGRTGVLVSGTDPAELAGAIATLAADANLRAAMGRRGRARVIEQFSWEEAGRKVSAIHGAALNKS